jgi:hypothetical protein
MGKKVKPKKKLYKHARGIISTVEDRVRDEEGDEELKAEENEMLFTGMRLLVDLAENMNRIADALEQR